MRDDFSKQTLDALAKRVGVRCSNPGCRKLTTGPRTDSDLIVNIGVGAHITAASRNGPRFAPSLSSAERQASDNGIWLCQNCAKLVDNDPTRYTVELLRNWKQRAEATALSEIEGVAANVEVPADSSVDIEIAYEKENIRANRHDYRLIITLTNLGDQPLGAYHIDLKLPARVVEKPEHLPLHVRDRSTREISFFRITRQEYCEELYPGDSQKVMALPYYIDHDIFINRGNLFAKKVQAVLYRPGFQPLTVEKVLDDLQVF
jgi:hypothetical protein